MPIIMGTAGHIDHGKTTLIKALTGIDCDRLEEEKRRGITIELGFAFLDLGGDRRLSIVDVPGHERFVKNMVAGAAGIDFVLMVIAADESVMPQTREHLEICSLLGIKTGVVALTKKDMVDEELLELAIDDVQNFVEDSFLGEAKIIPVSSHTKEGIDELRQELIDMMDAFKPKRRTDLFRLPIDRVFTMKGHGTVTTGTMVSGNVGVGEDVVLFPTDTTTKVRGLQSHGATVENAPAGRRTAVNVQGLDVADITRGQVLARPGTLFPSNVWDVHLTCLSSSPRALKHRTEIHFHHGSRESLARIYFMDRDRLEPGDSCLTQVRFEEPMVGVYGDRCVIRSFSPLRTVAGGKLINPLGRKVKRHSKDLEYMEALITGTGEELVQTQLDLAGMAGMSFNQLRIMSNLETKALETTLNKLSGQQRACLFDKEERIFASGLTAQTLIDAALAFLADYHKKEPLRQGIPRGALTSAWPRDLSPKLAHFVIERMLKKGDIVADAELLRLPDHKVSLASDQANLRKTLLEIYQEGGLTPKNLKDVLEPMDLTFKEAQPVYTLMLNQGELVKIKEDMFFCAKAVDGLKQTMSTFFADNEEMAPTDFKELTGLSRKFTIPLLEYLDKEKFTVRVGDKRRLRKK